MIDHSFKAAGGYPPLNATKSRMNLHGKHEKSIDLTPCENISGNLIDVEGGRIYPATIRISQGRIERIIPSSRKFSSFLAPGLVDAHVHIESSMLTPAEFARLAMTHGTVAALCDPHEIANVLGMQGIRYMQDNALMSPCMLAHGAPPCVPATSFETSGAGLSASDIERLLSDPACTHLSEVMNYPSVIAHAPDIMAKIDHARRLGKPVDGHAPGLKGDPLRRYIEAGITTDHETTSMDEALEKIALGMRIIIREGSAVGNFECLHDLISTHGDMCMFCSDDIHPDDLVHGHIDGLVRKAFAHGHDPLKVLSCASLNPVRHYGLPIGLLREGDPADFIVVDDLKDFRVSKVFIKGVCVAKHGKSLMDYSRSALVNRFAVTPKREIDFAIRHPGRPAHVIVAEDRSIHTGRIMEQPASDGGYAVADPLRDILKLTVINRYRDTVPATAFIRGFGLQRGALASSVAHDSHNIVALGVSDQDLCAAVNMVIANRGGLAIACGTLCEILPLPVAGLISPEDGYTVATRYAHLKSMAQALGTTLHDPFITLSFMALLVIPRLKLSDKGLFDVDRFALIDVFS